MSGPSAVAAVVLAAGRSRRAGARNKLLATLGGEPLVRHVVRTALAAGLDPVLVVVPPAEGGVVAALEELDVVPVANPAPEAGLSASLRRGIEAVPPGRDAAVVLLGDMPWVRPSTVQTLMAAFRESDPPTPCVPVHAGRRGNPVLWPRRFFSRLGSLEGDAGARSLLDGLGNEVRAVPVPDPGVLRDVDTAEDLTALNHPTNPNSRESPCPS